VKPVKVEQRDIVELWRQGETVCVTVSLVFQRKDGSGVMDRGNALAMARACPDLPQKLGQCIQKGRGEVAFLAPRIIAFFTKPKTCPFELALPDVVHLYSWDSEVPGNHCRADPVMVARSARQLLKLLDREKLERVYLPVPGVGDGGLEADDIAEALEVLDRDPRVVLVSIRPIPGMEMVQTEKTPA